ncbi:MAG TPA: hypothetical protein VIQ52_19510, partial [Arthrobacter sp.]
AGDAVRQSLLLEAATLEPQEAVEAAGAASAGDARAPGVVTAHVGGESGRVPALAVAAGTQPGVLPAIPGLDSVLVELVEEPAGAGSSESAGTGSSRSGWAAQLHAAAAAAAVHGAGLDIRAVTADPAGAVADLAPYLAEAKRLAVFHPASHVTEPDTWQEFKASARAAGFSGSLLAGTRAHFTELNRDSSRTPSDSDALTFSITPQMHSTEAAHIIDSVPMQWVAARNALRLAGGRPVHVGPVTLLPRFNAVATSGDAAEAEADELQDQPFTAAWMLASISALTLDGVASVSYFEASGPRGISDAGGRLNPAGELLKQLAALRDSVVLSVEVKAGQAEAGSVTLYPVQSPEGLIIFAGNLSGAAVAVDLRLPDGVNAGDGDPAPGRLVLGPWSAGVVRFPAADFPAPS